MKKLFLLTSILLLSVSCSYDTIYDGAIVETEYITIFPTDWIANVTAQSRNEGFASATFRMPIITPAVIKRGAVMCYLVGNEHDDPLPFSVTQRVGIDIFTNTLSFDVASGSIRFISENSDLILTIPNWSMTIKVVTIVNP